jgi:branched-subunit amino acid transport protein
VRWGLLGVFLAMGAVNYFCRAFFTVLVPRRGVGAFWERFLSAIPLSILTALAVPAVFAPGAGGALDLSAVPRLLAALLTVGVARLSGNLLVSVLSGALLFTLLSR